MSHLILLLFCALSAIHQLAAAVACVSPNLRFDCYPEPGVSQQGCEARGCCWEATRRDQPNVPACSYPENYGGYKTLNVTDTNQGFLAYLERSFPSAYPDDVSLLRAEGFYLSDTTLRIKISDPSETRFEAFYPKIANFDSENVSPLYKVSFNQSSTGFKVARDSGEDIFNSMNIGALTYADQFLEISTLLADSARLFGIGEHRSSSLNIKLDWQRFTLFNRDIPPAENTNLYGSHPFYIASDSSGRFYGVFLHNSNAMDILLTPRPALTFRTIGGILDFYFFLGPTPEDVVKQYTALVGRTLLPPLWSLGNHLCRFGYGSLEVTREVVQRNKDAGIIIDTQWNDMDYMDKNNIFTVNNSTFAGLPAFVDELHEAGMQYIVLVDPGVSGSEPPGTYPPYDLGVEYDVLVKNKSGDVLLGRVWNLESTAWVDFTHPKAQEYWSKLVSDFYKIIPIDGMWIDMNEPSNLNAEGSLYGCPDDNLENPPYTPGVVGDKLFKVTLCMSAKHYAGSHYNVHNLFGIAEAHLSNEAMRAIGKRPFVISRASYAGSGHYTGHWSGDNAATWEDLAKSVQELLTFNMYGVSLMGADICGFRGDTNQELCNRWYQLGAFYTFSRNHNGAEKDQDPAQFDVATVKSIQSAMNRRSRYVLYLYTLFYLSHTTGSTVARPISFEYPDDPEAYNEEYAFLWGSDALIVPVVQEGVTSVEAYIPRGTWYNFEEERADFTFIKSEGKKYQLPAPYSSIPMLLRAGSVFYQNMMRHSPISAMPEFEIDIVVLANEEGTAKGLVYWDDLNSIDPIENDMYGLIQCALYKNNTFTSRVKHWTVQSTKLPPPSIWGITVYGVETINLSKVLVNGQDHQFGNLTQDQLEANAIRISLFGPDYLLNNDLTIEWFY